MVKNDKPLAEENALKEVWQVVDSRNFGGIESHILQLAVGLKKMQLNVKVVFISYYGSHPMYQQLKQAGVEYIICKTQSLYTLIKAYHPCLIHSHGYKAGIMSRMAGLFSHTPVISTYHAGETPQGKVKIYDWLDRYSACLAKYRFAVSKDIQEKIPFQSQVSKNFVQSTLLPEKLNDNAGEQIAFVGRLSKEKGTEHLLAIAKQMPCTAIHVYGDGPEKATIKASSCHNLVLHGQQSNMNSIWPKVSVLLLPSLHEGLPMAAIEAMSKGIPVIASDVGDLHQLINHQQNGWLVPCGDIAGYVEAIQQWRGFSELEQKRCKKHAYQKVKDEYLDTKVLPQLISYYQAALS